MSGLTLLLDELADALVEFDPALWSGDDCAVIASRLARVGKACEAASVRATVRASDCGRLAERPTDFVARLHGSTLSAARNAIEVLDHARPETRDAVLAGDVSLEQAAAIMSAPEHEHELLGLARSHALGAVKERARKHRLASIKPEDLHDEQVAAQRFRSWRTDLGNIAFQGELTPEAGVPFINRLAAETDRLWRAASKNERARPREWHAAQAFARTVRGRARGKSNAADVVIVCDINAYRRGYAGRGEVSHIIGGGPIPVSLVQEIAKDAFLKAVLHDGTNVHTIAHFGRHRPALLQTALDLGAPPEFDGTSCTDCGRKYFLEWDHVDPVANDGMTSYENLKARCPPCHDEKTERDRKRGLLGRTERAP